MADDDDDDDDDDDEEEEEEKEEKEEDDGDDDDEEEDGWMDGSRGQKSKKHPSPVLPEPPETPLPRAGRQQRTGRPRELAAPAAEFSPPGTPPTGMRKRQTDATPCSHRTCPAGPSTEPFAQPGLPFRLLRFLRSGKHAAAGAFCQIFFRLRICTLPIIKGRLSYGQAQGRGG